jgi:hypothetical protein
MEKLAKDKHSSLLRTLVNYGCKKFYDIGCIWIHFFRPMVSWSILLRALKTQVVPLATNI